MTPRESMPAHLIEKQLDLIRAPIHREVAEEEEEEEIAVDFVAETEVPDVGTLVSLHPTMGTREETGNAGIATTTATGRRNAVSLRQIRKHTPHTCKKQMTEPSYWIPANQVSA